MHALYFILFGLAVVCFVLAAIGVPSRYVNWVALGLALATLVFAIQQFKALT